MDPLGGFYICDYDNNRIVFWKKGARVGQFITQCDQPTAVLYDSKEQRLIISEKGNHRVFQQSLENNQKRSVLISNIACRGLALDDEGCLYASDFEKHEVRRYRPGETNGTLVAGGNGQGDRLHQFNGLSRLFVDKDQSIYITDYENHRIMKWRKNGKEGMIVAGGRGQGDSLKHLSYPRGLWVDSIGSVIVADSENNRIMRWFQGAQQGNVIVEKNQLNTPMGLCLDAQGNLYVADSMNFSIKKFELESTK
jgi:sugar lactone lactonase YvrE